jgi:hypothetical protein
MIANLLLDFSIGLLLCISLCLFYELTVIFYVMMHIHLILIASLISALFNFRQTIGELLINPLSLIGYIVPFIVQILLSIIFVYIRSSFNRAITFQDVLIINTTPLVIVSLPFVFSNLQQLVSSSARFNIYESLNIIGLLSNTLILFLGGTLGLYIINRFNN